MSRPDDVAATLCGFECPRCGTLSVNEIREGELVKCPGCSIFFTAKIGKVPRVL